MVKPKVEELLKVKLNSEPIFFPSRSLLPSLAIISAKLLKYENVMGDYVIDLIVNGFVLLRVKKMIMQIHLCSSIFIRG